MKPGDLIFLAEHLKPPMVQQTQVSNGLIEQFQECTLAAPPLLLPASIASVNIWTTWELSCISWWTFRLLEVNALAVDVKESSRSLFLIKRNL